MSLEADPVAGIVRVYPDYRLNHHLMRFNDQQYRAALGKGITPYHLKREGDGATPLGLFPLRLVLYRADRLERPVTALETIAIQPSDGWSDDPALAGYNQKIRLPYAGSAEKLWRADGVYDLVIPLGFNDQLSRAHRGSAIFLHIAPDDFASTRGCVALARDDLLVILRGAGPQTMLRIYPEA